MWVSGEWFAQAGLAIRASPTSGANGRSSGSELAPKDESERIRLPIFGGARAGPAISDYVLLRHLRFEIGRQRSVIGAGEETIEQLGPLLRFVEHGDAGECLAPGVGPAFLLPLAPLFLAYAGL
jgi:hypothetical protein